MTLIFLRIRDFGESEDVREALAQAFTLKSLSLRFAYKIQGYVKNDAGRGCVTISDDGSDKSDSGKATAAKATAAKATAAKATTAKATAASPVGHRFPTYRHSGI